MKNSFSFIFYLSIAFSYCNAQNLVPNPYFDTTTVACNAGISSCKPYDYVQYATGWSSFGGTPDYYNACSNDEGYEYHNVGVPRNELGYQNAVMGNAYCGLVGWSENYREFIGAQLITPLVTGNKYMATVMVSRADSCSYAINKLGISFSLDAWTYVCLNYSATNHAMVYDTSVISKTGAWTTISGSFIADSDYAYVIVGNFFSDSLTDTVFEGEAKISDVAYYYVGFVSVVPDTVTKINNIGTPNNICIYPNPSSGKLYISGTQKITAVELYDMAGRLMLTQALQNNKATIDGSSLANGIYAIRLLSDEATVEKKLVIAR